MKTLSLCLFCGTVWLTAGAVGEESNDMSSPWTARMELGGNIPDNPSLTRYEGPVTGGDTMELGAGFQMNAALGYRCTRWLTLEAEFGMGVNEIKAVGNWSYPDSSLSQFSMMANVVLEYPVGRFVPYAGIGGGGVLSTVSFGQYNYYYYSEADGYGTDFVPAVQMLAGLRFRLGNKSTLGVAYRYQITDDQTWKVDWWNGTNFKVGVDSLGIHSICLSYSLSF